MIQRSGRDGLLTILLVFQPSGGGKGEQPCTDRNIINLVKDPSRLEHLIIHPTRPERIPRPGERISGREENEPRAEEKVSSRMPVETPSISFIIHLGQSAESFIRLGQSGFPGRGRESRAEKTANPRAAGTASSRMPFETPAISLIVHLR